MVRYLVLAAVAAFVVWLFVRDRKLRPIRSRATWIVLVWVVIVGSRSISGWFGVELPPIENPQDYLEGSPVDRAAVMLLIAMGCTVLWSRRIDLQGLFRRNQWVFLFFAFCLLSAVWSDYPFVSFKRWVKDLGNLVMVVILLTDDDPDGAFDAVLARFTSFAVPLSVLFIKYFPDIGRYYNQATWERGYCGVTTEKNALGAVAFTCGVYLVNNLVTLWYGAGRKRRAEMTLQFVLLGMTGWLIVKSSSSTSLVCLILGAGLVLFLRRPAARRMVRHSGAIVAAGLGGAMVLYAVPELLQAFVGVVGRDPTLTGRTDIWGALLKEQINPLLGTGYQSFWLGPGAEQLWSQYYFRPNQAHNGYLETYINCGLVGVGLLLGLIIRAVRDLGRRVAEGSPLAPLLLTLMLVMVVYNWTEAVINKMNLIWVVMLVAALQYPAMTAPKRRPVPGLTARRPVVGADGPSIGSPVGSKP